jgi:hypothetical protein
MNPQEVWCRNSACPARGQAGKGNIGVHSQKEHRSMNPTVRRRPIRSILPTITWSTLLEVIARDAPAGSTIEVHTDERCCCNEVGSSARPSETGRNITRSRAK